MQISYTKSKSGKVLTLTNNTSTYGGTNTSPYWVNYFGFYNRIKVTNLYDDTQSYYQVFDGVVVTPTSSVQTTLKKDGLYKIQLIIVPSAASGVLYNVGDNFVVVQGDLRRLGKCLVSNTINFGNIFDGTNFVEITEEDVNPIYKSQIFLVFDVTCSMKGICKKLKENNTEVINNPNFSVYQENGELKDIYKAINIITSLIELNDTYTADNQEEIHTMINFLKNMNCCEECEEC